jgi:hypothetical protein
MKSSIRAFVLAAFAAATFAASTSSASAQVYARVTTSNNLIAPGGTATPNAVILPQAGTYVFGGQQMLVVSGNQPTHVFCWISTKLGGVTPLPTGPNTGQTMEGGYVSIPLGGWYTASGPTELYVVCTYYGSDATVETYTGNITATLVP